MSTSHRQTTPGRSREEDFMRYVNGQMSEDEKRHFEKTVVEDDIDFVALEGLLAMGNEAAESSHKKITEQFHKNIKTRKGRKRKHPRAKGAIPWQMVLLLLFLLFIAALVYWFSINK